MQLIIKNDKIHLRYQSSSKIVTKSLRLKATKQNLKYAQTTLLPIFARLYAVSNIPPSPISTKRTKSAKKSNFAINFTQISSSNLPCILNLTPNSKPNHMPNFAPNSAQILASNPFANLCQKSLAKIALNCKLSTPQTARYVYRSLLNFISTRHISSPRHSDFEAYFLPSPHQKSQHRDRQTPPILYKFSTQICHHQARKYLRLCPKFHHIATSPIKFHQTNTNPPSRHKFHHLSPQNTIFTIANCASNTHRDRRITNISSHRIFNRRTRRRDSSTPQKRH